MQPLTSFSAGEGSLGRVRDSIPHTDGFGVSRVHCSLFLVVAPVLVSFKKVGFPNDLPANRCIDAVSGEEAAQLQEVLRVTRLHLDLLKHPELIT